MLHLVLTNGLDFAEWGEPCLRLALAALAGGLVGAERERMDIYADLPTHVLIGLAAQELAGKLEKIEHLNISPEMLGPILQRLIKAGTKHLENGEMADEERN